jgi:carbonic anhydrase
MTANDFKPLIWALLLLLLLPMQSPARDQGGHSGTPRGAALPQWGYDGETGPEHWAELSSAFATCGSGQMQSPVDVTAAEYQYLPKLSFHYRTSMMSIFRQPHSIWLDYDDGSYLKIKDKRYQLKGFDFHTPGEHVARGRVADMEVHLHHIGPGGENLIVAIPVIGGRRGNITLSRILERIPPVGQRSHNRRAGTNPLFLLPANRDYYVYKGSDSKPPCAENVNWIILSSPVEVDREEVGRFRSLLGNNARPVQPVNNRVILTNARL